MVGEQKFVAHEVGLKLMQEFGLSDYFPKLVEAYGDYLPEVLMRLAAPGASKRRADARLRSHFGVNVPLHRVYRMMDNLSDGSVQHAQREELYWELSARLFFDATTLYFEVNNSDELRTVKMVSQHVQVVLALVQTVEGLPIGYELFPGNTADVSTCGTEVAGAF